MMDSLIEKLPYLLLCLLLLIILLVVPIVAYSGYKAHKECSTAGGVYLGREGVCIDRKAIK